MACDFCRSGQHTQGLEHHRPQVPARGKLVQPDGGAGHGQEGLGACRRAGRPFPPFRRHAEEGTERGPTGGACQQEGSLSGLLRPLSNRCTGAVPYLESPAMTSAMTPALTAAMTPVELRTLIDRYRAEGLVPPGPLVCSGGRAPDGSFNPFGTVADLVVDLKVLLDEADAAGLQALDIHADTVVVPEGFDRRLDGAVRRLTVVARRIVSEGTTVLRMLHDEDNELSRVRIFVETVEGRFTLYGGPTRDTPYALEAAWDTVARPQFSNFLWQDNRAVVKHTPVPPGLLEHGEPDRKSTR